MIKGIYVFHSNGLPLFNVNIDDEEQILDEIVFAGVSSAIDVFLKELGHQNLYSITTTEGTLIYTSAQDLIFVVHALTVEEEQFGKFLIKQIELEFFKAFNEILLSSDKSYVDRKLYEPFKEKAMEIYNRLFSLYNTNPIFFEYFPNSIQLGTLLELLEQEKDLLEGFPDDTIKLIRTLYENYDDSMREPVLLSVGKYFGYELTRRRTKHKIASNVSDVMKLINELSVAKYDSEKEQIILKLCPVCRGKRSTKPICYFFSGFIQGCFDNPKLTVNEINCQAKGDKNCVFQIERKHI